MSASRQRRSVIGPRPIPACVGLDLRPAHHDWVLDQRPAVSWFEVHAQHCMTASDAAAELRNIALDYPLSLHAAGLSLEELRELVMVLQPGLISDILPLPYTQDALKAVVRNIHSVQENLGRRLLLENAARCTPLIDYEMSEGEFIAEMVLRTGCGLLLNINNLRLTASYTDVSARALLDDYLSHVSPQDIAEIHLTGSGICPDVQALFEATLAAIGPVPTLMAWDTVTPAFERLQTEAATVQSILSRSVSIECQRSLRLP